jgi:hypothetical protein
MNVQETTVTRELTAEEINTVSGAMLAEILAGYVISKVLDELANPSAAGWWQKLQWDAERAKG